MRISFFWCAYFLLFSFILRAEDLDKAQALNKENQTIISSSQNIKAFYELGKHELWRDVTQEVLDSLDTSETARSSILQNHRRILVFKYRSDGLWIKGFLSYVPNPEHLPLLIIYRWGNQDFALMNPGADLATYRDYTTVSSALRGGISEGHDEFGGADINDMKNLIDYLPHLAELIGIKFQPSCVFMLGPSRGGMEMFLTLAHFPDLQLHVDKIVSLSGVLDMRSQIQERPYDMKVMFEQRFGLTKENQETWIERRDPLLAAAAIRPTLPVLIIQGTADDRINLREGYNMVHTLRSTGHDVTYWEVKGGKHVLANIPNAMNSISRWLEFNSTCQH